MRLSDFIPDSLAWCYLTCIAWIFVSIRQAWSPVTIYDAWLFVGACIYTATTLTAIFDPDWDTYHEQKDR